MRTVLAPKHAQSCQRVHPFRKAQTGACMGVFARPRRHHRISSHTPYKSGMLRSIPRVALVALATSSKSSSTTAYVRLCILVALPSTASRPKQCYLDYFGATAADPRTCGIITLYAQNCRSR